ncbi:MAG: hypothetical protein JKY53_08630 [Flavobacteriales bacterium]|nr:hypothetical protein [Flavobacteriales bacterium]
MVDLGNNQSALDMEVTMNMKKFAGSLMGGMFKKNLNKLFPVLFSDLKIYAETGDVSADKKKRKEKLVKKS